jgi:hypothetical protein
MAHTVARHLLALAAAASVAALAGCFPSSAPDASNPPGTGSPSASAPTPTPSPTDDARVSEILITAEVIELRSGDGAVVTTFDYFQPTAEVVEGLTEAFGAEPKVEQYQGNHAAGTRHSWEGFSLQEPDFVEPPYYPEHWLLVTAESAHGVDVRTIDGIAVGDPAPELEAAYPASSKRVVAGDKPERLDILVGAIPLPDPEETPGSDRTFSVFVSADDPAGAVTSIRAPSPNFGA